MDQADEVPRQLQLLDLKSRNPKSQTEQVRIFPLGAYSVQALLPVEKYHIQCIFLGIQSSGETEYTLQLHILVQLLTQPMAGLILVASCS